MRPVEERRFLEPSPIKMLPSDPCIDSGKDFEDIASNTSKYTLEDTSTSSLGVPCQKSKLSATEILALFTSIICLVLSIVVVSDSRIAFRLRMKGQLQATGLLLAIMNICLRTIIHRVFLIIEATLGPSRLQNFEAILSNSIFLSHTNLFWRLLLAANVALPLGLGFAYKDFQQGYVHATSIDLGKRFGPLGTTGSVKVASPETSFNGLHWMASALTPFMSEISDIDQFMTFGFNGLLLNRTAVAFPDMPFPDYTEKFWSNSNTGDFALVTASVNATVAVYDSEVESHRTVADDYWKTWNWTESWVNSVDLDSSLSLGLFQNMSPINRTTHTGDQSWAFVSIYDRTSVRNFPQNATKFSIKRHKCDITWLIESRTESNTIRVYNGSCDPQPLGVVHQRPYTENDLGLPAWYM